MSVGRLSFVSFPSSACRAAHSDIDPAGASARQMPTWLPLDTHLLPLPIALPDDLRALEARALQDAGPHHLMARAGAAAADFLLQHRVRDGKIERGVETDQTLSTATPATAATEGAEPIRFWFFVGPGNNGGDALVAATQLHRRGLTIRVTLPVAPKGGDALWALEEAQREGVPIQEGGPTDAQCRALLDQGWCVDGLFGIGLSRPIEAPYARWVRLINAFAERGGAVLALDLPSGLDATTGQRISTASAPGCVVNASHTMSFLGATPGLFTGSGRDHSGKLFLAPLSQTDFSVPTSIASRSPQALSIASESATNSVDAKHPEAHPRLQLNAPASFMRCFTKRRPSSHKGTFGSVAIIGGDTGTCGAAILSARAALYTGAGRVHTALLGDGAPPYDPPHPEIMLRRIDAIALDTMDALSIGPGLGTSTRAADIVQRVLHDVVGEHCHALLDADALNLVSRTPALADAVAAAGDWLVMTPHPGEAARLLDVDTKEIERARLAAARALVTRFRCTVVLKGAGTLIASPRRPSAKTSTTDASVDIVLNTTGNTGLATGGTGDVLSGVIGALLAQHLPPREAAMAGVYLHGLAAEALGRAGEGPAGLTAGELAPMIRRLLNDHLREYGLIAD